MSTMNPLAGPVVRLTALSRQDLPTMAHWQENGTFLRLLDASPAYPRDAAQLEEWLAEHLKRPDTFVFAIRPASGEELVGYLELDGILWNHRSAWVSIAVAPEHQGKGYGTAAMELVLGFAFGELNLHRVQLTVFAYNSRAVALYERLGFVREGVYREFLERDGQRYDMLLYGLLRHEWEARQSAPPDQ